MSIDPDPSSCAALRADLSSAGYTADAVRSAWGPLADDAIGRGLTGPALSALDGRTDALAIMCRLLFLGGSVSVAEADAALPALCADGLQRLGLAEVYGDRVVATALVRPQEFSDGQDDTPSGDGQWWIASDLDETALGGALPIGHVLGVGGASLTLAGLQLTTPVTLTLDVGTGCGIQAFRALRNSARVVATDVSRRALEFTRLNALLNDLHGVEVRHGSLFEPVDGEQFDRIVSNPPFVITPRVGGVPAYEYRDGGMGGDDLVATFISQVGSHLVPGGTAQLLANWEYRAGEDGLDRVRGWVAASDVALNAWVIEREYLDPLAYAELWVRDGGTVPGTPDYERLIEAWLADFVARGVSGIGFGYVLLRRTEGETPTLARYERVTHPVPGTLGSHVTSALATHDVMETLDDEELAAEVVVVSADVTEARHQLPGAEGPSVIELRQGGALGRVIEVDPALAALVGASDGDLKIGVLIAAIAELLEVDAEALRDDLLPRVRELLFTGFLRFTGADR